MKVTENKLRSLSEVMSLVSNTIKATVVKGSPKELYEPIDYIMQLGGKRLRPCLVCLSCDMLGGDVSRALHAAQGIEFFHNFTLVHDDIMDNASLRRGKQTIHEKWGENVAILSGDAMLIKSYDFVLEGRYENLGQILETFNRAALEVCEGQQLDMNFENEDQVSIEAYLNMIKLKTSVLLGAALKIGAFVADASLENSELVYDFGVNMGIGFQLMDDYLDAFGDPSKFGKKVGGDIISNKKTFLFIKALELDENGVMDFWLKAKSFDETEKVEAVKKVYQDTGVDQLCLDKMHHYYDLAMSRLEQVKVSDQNKKTLIEFADYIKNRVQ